MKENDNEQLSFFILPQASKDIKTQEVWRKVLLNADETLVPSVVEGIRTVTEDNFVHLSADTYLNDYWADCRLSIVSKTPQFTGYSSFALKKGSPLTPLLNIM